MQKKHNSQYGGGNGKEHGHFGKHIHGVFIMLNIVLSHNSAIVLVDIYPNDCKIYVHTRAFTWMFLATVFIIKNGG